MINWGKKNRFSEQVFFGFFFGGPMSTFSFDKLSTLMGRFPKNLGRIKKLIGLQPRPNGVLSYLFGPK